MLQAALEAGAAVFGGVNRDLVRGEPWARRNFARRRHFGRDRLGHALLAVHDVVGWHLGELFAAVVLERMRLVGFPVRALEMVVGAKERRQPLGGASHVLIRLARTII